MNSEDTTVERTGDNSSDSFSEQENITLRLLREAEKNGWHDLWLVNVLKSLPQIGSAFLAVCLPEGNQLRPVASRLLQSKDSTLLGDLAEEAIHSVDPLVMPVEGKSNSFLVAYPIVCSKKLVAVVACEAHFDTSKDIESFMSQLEWFCLWIEHDFIRKECRYYSELANQQSSALNGFAAIAKFDGWREAALQWADELLKEFDCERVSLGVVKQERVCLEVISGSSDGDLKSLSSKKIRNAMQESLDQRESISWPSIEGGLYVITQNTEKLSSAHHNANIITILLLRSETPYAVLLLERRSELPFTSSEYNYIDSVLNLVALSLDEKRRSALPLIEQINVRLKDQLKKLFSTGFMKRKLALMSLIFLCLFFALVRGDYRVNADVEVEPQQIRIISAPFDGYIQEAPLRAGDTVAEGSALLSIEDRDIRLEEIKWRSQIEHEEKQYVESLAERNRADVQINFAKMAQSKAQLDIVISQLGRSIVKSPFDALIVSGDLSKRVGGSVKQGEELFQVSPMNAYRLVLFVNEYKIRHVKLGEKGKVVLSSVANQDFGFVVDKVTPVTEVRDGGTYYRVEALVEDPYSLLRPGMVGVAKVEAGQRLLIDMWTIELRRWLSLKLWSFWG